MYTIYSSDGGVDNKVPQLRTTQSEPLDIAIVIGIAQTYSCNVIVVCISHTCLYNVIVVHIYLSKGVATRSESSNEIVSVTSYLRKTIVTIAFANDFVQGGHVELFRIVES